MQCIHKVMYDYDRYDVVLVANEKGVYDVYVIDVLQVTIQNKTLSSRYRIIFMQRSAVVSDY